MTRHTRHIATVGLIVAVVMAAYAVPNNRVFPVDSTLWNVDQWEQMSDSERYFFIHGHMMGVYVTHQAIATEIDAGRSIDDIRRELQRTEAYLRTPGGTTLRATTQYYAQNGRAPMMVAPILTTEDITLRQGEL